MNARVDVAAFVAAALLAEWNDVDNVVASTLVGDVPMWTVDWVSDNLAVVHFRCEWN